MMGLRLPTVEEAKAIGQLKESALFQKTNRIKRAQKPVLAMESDNYYARVKMVPTGKVTDNYCNGLFGVSPRECGVYVVLPCSSKRKLPKEAYRGEDGIWRINIGDLPLGEFSDNKKVIIKEQIKNNEFKKTKKVYPFPTKHCAEYVDVANNKIVTFDGEPRPVGPVILWWNESLGLFIPEELFFSGLVDHKAIYFIERYFNGKDNMLTPSQPNLNELFVETEDNKISGICETTKNNAKITTNILARITKKEKRVR